VLCGFAGVFVLCFAFGYFHCVHLCSPPLSGFSARLRALLDPLTNVVLSDYMFVCWRVCLLTRLGSEVDFYFIDLAVSSGRVNFRSF
jgi:hypothetical protein